MAAALGIYGTRPPAALGADAAVDQFSATRAIAHLSHFASVPHPRGSAANAQSRDYLIATLRDLGATVRVEETVGRTIHKKVVQEGRVQNIVATLPGQERGRGVMLVAHYDSVPTGPGAADDGAGVVSILETLRALRAGPPLANDLLVLLTDGEEAGLLGAAGFVAAHSDLARQVGVVINLEARGTSGPALIFETSEQNGWLIPEFARAAPRPLASSLMYSVYRLMPNDTDLTELKRTGVGAFNFAFTETVRNYHASSDTVENLDPRSVQHMGVNVLGLVRHLGNLPLTEVKQSDCIYFNWLGQRLVFYPVGVAWILSAVTFTLLFGAFVIGQRRGLMRWSALSLGAFFILFLSISGGMLVVWLLLRAVIGDPLQLGDTLGNQLLFLGLVVLAFALGSAIMSALSAKLGARTLAAGLLLVAAILTTILILLLPGASYLLQWPALLGAGSLLLGLRARTAAGNAGWAVLAALPVVLLLAPLFYLFFANLGLSQVSLLATALLLTLLLATAWPLFDFIYRPRRAMTLACAIAALLLIVGGVLLSRLTNDRERAADQGTRKILPLALSTSNDPRR
ncbi:MAG: M28 family peptidase [Chthoniobacterales bacterium]|nr:M28 family peptidase [Chthoniobacterales bacterium]